MVAWAVHKGQGKLTPFPVYLCNEVVRELDFNAQCELAASLGYAGLEIAPFTLSPEPHELPASQRTRLRDALAGHGLQAGGLHWLLLAPEGLSITSDDESVRARTLQVMCGLIELCADLGGKVLVHGSPRQREPLPGDPEGSRERAIEAFAAAGEHAARHGVTYLIEPLSRLETPFINSIAEAAAIVDLVGSPGLSAMLDCRAARLSEADDVVTLLKRWLPGGYVRHVHLNDVNSRAPGQGDDTFAEVLACLQELDYQGGLGVEPFIYEPDGPATARAAAEYLQNL